MRLANDENMDVTTDKKGPVSMIICVIFIVLFGILTWNAYKELNVLNATIEKQEEQLEALDIEDIDESDIEDVIEDMVDDNDDEDIDDTLPSGLSPKRVAKDTVVIEEFLKQTLTWKNHDEYIAARNALIETYQVTETDALVTTFMPSIGVDAFGSSNMRYERLNAQVTNIENDVYTYFTLVDTTASNASGSRTSGQIGFVYAIDANGIITNVSANTLIN